MPGGGSTPFFFRGIRRTANVEKRANELEREGECERFLVRHKDPVDKFLEIAERRVL